MKFLKFNFVAALLVIGGFGCDSKEPGIDDNEVNISDGNAVSKNLEFQNASAESKEGEFPAPSTDAGAPILDADAYTNDITSISGNNFILDIQEYSGSELKGMYLQVDGANTYFDISLESAPTGRLAGRVFTRSARMQGYLDDLLISLPENMGVGEFCVTFSVYDVQNRVSNPINVCIAVLKAGGENSGFLTANAWEMVHDYYKDVYDANGDGVSEKYESRDTVGVMNYDHYTYPIQCSDASFQDFDLTNESKTNYLYVTFSPDGSVALEDSYYEKYFDYENSTCDNIIYIEDQESNKTSGTWSYDAAKKELTMILEYLYEEEGVEMTDVDVEKYKVESGDSFLKISNEETDGEYYYYYEMTLQPKQ